MDIFINKEETKLDLYTLEGLARAVALAREEEARQRRPHTEEGTAARSG